MTDTDKDPQENIEKCFEEIKQVLKKYECEIFPYNDGSIKIRTANNCKFYDYNEFNK